jgi:hypothetical protein
MGWLRWHRRLGLTGGLDVAAGRLKHEVATKSLPDKERATEAHLSSRSTERQRNRGWAMMFRWWWQLLVVDSGEALSCSTEVGRRRR